MRMRIGCLSYYRAISDIYLIFRIYASIRIAKNIHMAIPNCNSSPFLKGGGCKGGAVDTSLGHLQHYREFCVQELKKICKEAYGTNIERDTSVWKWREIVIKMLREKGVI